MLEWVILCSEWVCLAIRVTSSISITIAVLTAATIVASIQSSVLPARGIRVHKPHGHLDKLMLYPFLKSEAVPLSINVLIAHYSYPRLCCCGHVFSGASPVFSL